MEKDYVRFLFALLAILLFICCTASEKDQNCTALKSSQNNINCINNIEVLARKTRALRSPRQTRTRWKQSRRRWRKKNRRSRKNQSRRKKSSCRIRIFSPSCTSRKKKRSSYS